MDGKAGVLHGGPRFNVVPRQSSASGSTLPNVPARRSWGWGYQFPRHSITSDMDDYTELARRVAETDAESQKRIANQRVIIDRLTEHVQFHCPEAHGGECEMVSTETTTTPAEDSST